MEASNLKVLDSTANPAPLGLLGFGLTTVLLNLHNAGLYPLDSMLLAMGIFYGGIAQIIAGIMEWKKNNTFGTTAFTSYGLFWLSLAGILILPQAGVAIAAEPLAMGYYLFIWGLFTAVMFIATLKINGILQFVFASLALLFFLLAIRDWTGNALIGTIAGIEGVICGASAIYAGLAQVLNEVYDRTVMPMWPVKA